MRMNVIQSAFGNLVIVPAINVDYLVGTFNDIFLGSLMSVNRFVLTGFSSLLT